MCYIWCNLSNIMIMVLSQMAHTANKVTEGDLVWRGSGGVVPDEESVEYDQQLDKLSLWVEKWNHQQVKAI